MCQHNLYVEYSNAVAQLKELMKDKYESIFRSTK